MLSNSNLNQSTNEINAIAKTRLGKMMLQIHREGDMDQVVIVFEKITRLKNRYSDNLMYRIFLPLPSLLVWQLENKLKSNAVTRVLIDTLDTDEIALWISNGIYTISWLCSLAFLVVIFMKNYQWAVLFGLFAVVMFVIQVFQFEYAIREVGFVSLYEKINNAIQVQRDNYDNFVKKIYNAYDKIQQKELDTAVQKKLDKLDAEQRENYQRLELESQQNLQTLSAAVALTQAENEEQIKNLRNKSNLDYMAAELRIKDEAGMNERAHQIALATIKKEEKVLSELAKELGEENEKNRDLHREIKRMQVILAGMTGDFQRNGRAGMYSENVNQAAQEFVDRKYRSTK